MIQKCATLSIDEQNNLSNFNRKFNKKLIIYESPLSKLQILTCSKCLLSLYYC